MKFFNYSPIFTCQGTLSYSIFFYGHCYKHIFWFPFPLKHAILFVLWWNWQTRWVANSVDFMSVRVRAPSAPYPVCVLCIPDFRYVLFFAPIFHYPAHLLFPCPPAYRPSRIFRVISMHSGQPYPPKVRAGPFQAFRCLFPFPAETFLVCPAAGRLFLLLLYRLSSVVLI